jgi:hypothetical protein
LLDAKRFRRTGENEIMDWIEQIFHVSPDAGNGSLELLLILCPLVAFLVGFLTLIWLSGRMIKRKGRKK